MGTPTTRRRPISGRTLLLSFAGVIVGIMLALQIAPYIPGLSNSRLGEIFSGPFNSAIVTLSGIYSSVFSVGSYGPVGQGYGIAAGGSLTALNAADLNKFFDEASASGAGWVRFDIPWSGVQPQNAGTYSWDAYDRVISAASAHHIQVLGIIDFTPAWARDSSCTGGIQCAPKDAAQFAAFAGQVASRYKSFGVHYWEIWNEQNSSGFWAPAANCQNYTTLLQKSYVSIKVADPLATVITGGLAPQDTGNGNISQGDFLKCVYASGGKGFFDAVADHPYTFPQLPSSNNATAWKGLTNGSSSLRAIMVANGDGDKKIWLTEFGSPTGGPDAKWYVSEDLQASILSDALSQYQKFAWAAPIFVYSLRDSGTAATTNENFFGLEHKDWSRKPAFAVFKSAAASTTATSTAK